MPVADDDILIAGAYAIGTIRIPVKTMVRLPDGTTRTQTTYKAVRVRLPVYGWEIKINPLKHDIEEAAIVTNLNFRVKTKQSPLKAKTDLQGPMDMPSIESAPQGSWSGTV
jgi:hypothetical protein